VPFLTAVLVSLVVLSTVLSACAASSPGPSSAGSSRPPAAVACGTTGADAPTCGRWWGLALPAGTSNTPTAVLGQERASGRRLDIVHTYHRWFDDFPTAGERALAASGHLLFINWEPTDQQGRPMSWAAIAMGAQDATIDAEAQRLKALPTVLISFSHEPEYLYGQHGSATDFAAAFRHIHDRMRADGATNVKWVWDVMGLSDPVWRARYASLWPGASYVDWVAWDPYNWASCRGDEWKSFDQIVHPFYSWLLAQGYGGKPFMLAEYGTVEQAGAVTGKASWFAAVPAALAAMPNLRALVYFDVAAPPANCDWQVTTSASALAAFDDLATSSPFVASARLPPESGAVN
jgi:hypothetical protein